MIDKDPTIATIPVLVETRRPETGLDPSEPQPDRRPRGLRWLLPTACSTAVPLNGFQQARLKLVAYH